MLLKLIKVVYLNELWHNWSVSCDKDYQVLQSYTFQPQSKYWVTATQRGDTSLTKKNLKVKRKRKHSRSSEKRRFKPIRLFTRLKRRMGFLIAFGYTLILVGFVRNSGELHQRCSYIHTISHLMLMLAFLCFAGFHSGKALVRMAPLMSLMNQNTKAILFSSYKHNRKLIRWLLWRRALY